MEISFVFQYETFLLFHNLFSIAILVLSVSVVVFLFFIWWFKPKEITKCSCCFAIFSFQSKCCRIMYFCHPVLTK